METGPLLPAGNLLVEILGSSTRGTWEIQVPLGVLSPQEEDGKEKERRPGCLSEAGRAVDRDERRVKWSQRNIQG